MARTISDKMLVWIPAISNTPRQTHYVRNYIFPHFVMVITYTVLWAELWFGVACCHLAESVVVGIVHKLIGINVGYFRYIEQEREDTTPQKRRYGHLAV